MKFNEKLIELRKKEGLSQEELGYKLNVTRQTVSKWELGQTTPEMDKLIEISKMFNISVDELIKGTEEDKNINVEKNQTEPIKDQPIVEKNTKNKIIVIVLVAALVIVVGMMGVKIFSGINLFNNAKDSVKDAKEQGLNQVFGLFDKASGMVANQLDTNNDIEAEANNNINSFIDKFNDMNEKYSDLLSNNKVDVNAFNAPIEIYSGTASRLFTETMLDSIVTSNKKYDRKITVKYNKIETMDVTEIKNIKKELHKIKASEDFDITCEYDKDGYIYEVLIEKM